MRKEAIFRVWNGSEMIYDVVVGKFGVFYVNPSNNGLDPNDSASLTPNTTRYAEDTPLMQFTGLVDKNGVKMFEGDLIKMLPSGDVGKLVYDHRLAMYMIILDIYGGEHSATPYSKQNEQGWNLMREVVGNIYKNGNRGI